MLSRLTARMAFGIAMGLLLVCALLVYQTTINLAESERLVSRTHHVQELLGEAESTIASAARNRLTYVFSGDEDAFIKYQDSVVRIHLVLKDLRQNVADNPSQQKN